MDGKIHWGEVDYYSLLKNVAFCLVLLLLANIVAGTLSKPYGKRQRNS